MAGHSRRTTTSAPQAALLSWLDAGNTGPQSPPGSHRQDLASLWFNLLKAGPASPISLQKLPATESLPGSSLRSGGQGRGPGSPPPPPPHHVPAACGGAQTAEDLRPAGLLVPRGRHCHLRAPVRSPESISAPATPAPPIPPSSRCPGRGRLELDPLASWLKEDGRGGWVTLGSPRPL